MTAWNSSYNKDEKNRPLRQQEAPLSSSLPQAHEAIAETAAGIKPKRSPW
jgi:hypothetical protein